MKETLEQMLKRLPAYSYYPLSEPIYETAEIIIKQPSWVVRIVAQVIGKTKDNKQLYITAASALYSEGLQRYLPFSGFINPNNKNTKISNITGVLNLIDIEQIEKYTMLLPAF